MDSKKKEGPPAAKAGGTTIDFGEDLLEQKKPDSPPHPTDGESNDEKFLRAEIMVNERLFDDAKKILRRILRSDPGNAQVKEKLLEIQKHEIQELLAAESARKKMPLQKNGEPQQTSDEIIESLERDLLLDLGSLGLKPVPDLFGSKADYEGYIGRVVAQIIPLPVRNRIDVGIAHMEMGLFEAAAAIFGTVARYEEQRLEGMYLLCASLIHCGQAIEATIRLEPLARDLALPESYKTDFLYLMGLAFEKLGDLKKAREFYRRAQILDPKYRDVTEKLNGLK